jgi:hypothetical protein
MVVVLDKAIGITTPIISVNDFPKSLEEDYAIPVVQEDKLLQVTYGTDVVDRTFILVPELSSHMMILKQYKLVKQYQRIGKEKRTTGT